jgi:hypothetical protein
MFQSEFINFCKDYDIRIVKDDISKRLSKNESGKSQSSAASGYLNYL